MERKRREAERRESEWIMKNKSENMRKVLTGKKEEKKDIVILRMERCWRERRGD